MNVIVLLVSWKGIDLHKASDIETTLTTLLRVLPNGTSRALATILGRHNEREHGHRADPKAYDETLQPTERGNDCGQQLAQFRQLVIGR